MYLETGRQKNINLTHSVVIGDWKTRSITCLSKEGLVKR